MKIVNLLLLSVLLISGICYASAQIQDPFVLANLLYEQGKYEQALQLYEKVENKDFAVWYNMGLAALHSDDLAYATFYFQQAHVGASYQQLTLLQDVFDTMRHDADSEYVKSWLESFLNFMKKCILSISVIMMQSLILILVSALLCIWWTLWYQQNIKISIIMMVLWIVIQSLFMIKMHLIEEKIGVVVDKKPVAVVAGPDISFFMKAELQPAEIVKVGKVEKGYVQIFSKQCVGWVREQDIKIVQS